MADEMEEVPRKLNHEGIESARHMVNLYGLEVDYLDNENPAAAKMVADAARRIANLSKKLGIEPFIP